MDVFIYQASLYCEGCGYCLRGELNAPDDVDDESTYDSDEFPKGPYCDGGGEADSPQHCDSCGVFLENPLTGDGVEYVREAIAAATGKAEVLAEWSAFYADSLAEGIEEEEDSE